MREQRSGDYELGSSEVFLSRCLVFLSHSLAALSQLSHAVKNQEKPLGPVIMHVKPLLNLGQIFY